MTTPKVNVGLRLRPFMLARLKELVEEHNTNPTVPPLTVSSYIEELVLQEILRRIEAKDRPVVA